MKPFHLIAASSLALAAAACGPKVPPARVALDCPETQGELTRTGVAPDRRSCAYRAADGAEVTLQLVSTAGGVDPALRRIESALLAGRQAAAAKAKVDPASGETTAEKAAAAATGATGDIEPPAPPQPPAPPPAGTDAARAAAEAAADADVTISVGPGGAHKVVTGHGETTRVTLPGIHIVANDKDETADVKIGPLSVNAGSGSATIRMQRDVRLRGEALSRERRGVRATFIYTGEDLPDGYRFVGYEAGGPKAGPLTVAIVKARTEGPDGHELYPDVKRLVRRNGGV